MIEQLRNYDEFEGVVFRCDASGFGLVELRKPIALKDQFAVFNADLALSRGENPENYAPGVNVKGKMTGDRIIVMSIHHK